MSFKWHLQTQIQYKYSTRVVKFSWVFIYNVQIHGEYMEYGTICTKFKQVEQLSAQVIQI